MVSLLLESRTGNVSNRVRYYQPLSTGNYLRDFLYQLIEDAALLKRSASSEFEKGVLPGYYQVIARLLNQAEVFGVANRLPAHAVHRTASSSQLPASSFISRFETGGGRDV